MEKAVLDTVEAGFMTKDLALITTLENPTVLNSEEFIDAVKKTFDGESPANADSRTTALCDEFFDTRSYKRKIEIVRALSGSLNDKMITDFAVSLDVVIEDGPFDSRYMSLMNCLNQMAKFETEGLR